MDTAPANSSPQTASRHNPPAGCSPGNVALVLLNFQGAHDTLACLQAVAAMPDKPGRVVVVDNGSRDDSPAALTAWISARGGALNAEFLPLPENSGYAAGNNAGIRRALEDPRVAAVWILNNDTEPQPGALDALCRALDENRAGLAGSTLVYAHAPDTVQCAGGHAVNRFSGATTALHGNKPLQAVQAEQTGTRGALPGASGGLFEGLFLLYRFYNINKYSYICGASLLARREVVERIGLLAEEYFLYYEDAEYSLRAARAGYPLAWARDSLVRHKEGGSTGAETSAGKRGFQRPESVDYLSLRNRIHLVAAYFPLSLPVAVAGYAGVMLNRVRRGQAGRIPLVLRALRDGLAGRMGPPPADITAAVSAKGTKHRGGASEPGCAQAVLFITARADFGGGPEHLWQLLRHLPGDIAAHVACPREFPYYDRFSEIVTGANMAEIPHRKFTFAAFFSLRRFCREHRISVLHSHGKGAGLYSRLLTLATGIPCVHTFHGVHVAEYGPLKRRVYRVYERAASWVTRAGIAVSEGEKQRIVQEGLMCPAKLRCIPNGVSVPDEAATGCAGPPYRVVSLSRFDYQKNSAFLVRVLEALRDAGRADDFLFELIGDGVERHDIRALAEESGVAPRMRFIGATSTPHTYFSGAFCYISSSRWEGMPLGVLEAMAHGLPPVASDVVGNRDAVVHGETGLLYPQGDAEAAAAALCCIADDATLRKSLGEKARSFVQQRHDVRHMAVRTAVMLRWV